MEKIDNILEDILIVRTHEDVINYRGSLYNAARKWWYVKAESVKQANYVMVVVDNIVLEVYKPDKKTWHLEKDPGNDIKKFDGERWVFGIQNDSDDGEYCKSMLAPDSIRQKYVGKKLPECYCWTQGQQNPVKYSF